MRMTIPLLSLSTLLAPAVSYAECNHAYFPAKAGTTWTYKDADGGQNVMTVKGVEGTKIMIDAKVVKAAGEEGKKKGKRDRAEDGPTEVSLVGECTPEGVRLNLGGVQVKGVEGMEMKSVSQSGYTLAPAAKLTAGSTWTEENTSSMSGEGAPVQMSMASKTLHKVIGAEKVKVPAGEFDAIKIEGDREMTMTIEGPMAAMMPKQPPQKGKTTSWVVKGIGVVKTEAVMTDAKGKPKTQITELVSYSIGK